jgi:hypothetical protein
MEVGEGGDVGESGEGACGLGDAHHVGVEDSRGFLFESDEEDLAREVQAGISDEDTAAEPDSGGATLADEE